MTKLMMLLIVVGGWLAGVPIPWWIPLLFAVALLLEPWRLWPSTIDRINARRADTIAEECERRGGHERAVTAWHARSLPECPFCACACHTRPRTNLTP